MVYPTPYPTDGGVVGQFTRTKKNEFLQFPFGEQPTALKGYYFARLTEVASYVFTRSCLIPYRDIIKLL